MALEVQQPPVPYSQPTVARSWPIWAMCARGQRSTVERTSSERFSVATKSDAPIGPYGLRYGEGDAYWFLDFLTIFKATTGTTDGGFALLEQRAAKGAGSPLHVHRREAESFYVLDGELTIWAGGQLIEAPAGSFVYGPPNVPHTFTVASNEARFLLLTQPAGFDAFLRAFGQAATSATLPPPTSEPPDVELLTALAAEHGIEILGPPGIPDSSSRS
jgi:quercetin dioxygenase-like cupin family protein